MRGLCWLFITSSMLVVIACSQKPKQPAVDEFIIGTWQSNSESPSSVPNSEFTAGPDMMNFSQDGTILWDMTTQDKTLRFAGDYRFIDSNTIRVDFVRYSNKSAIWDIACSSPSPLEDSITIKDRDTDHVVATLKRIYCNND